MGVPKERKEKKVDRSFKEITTDNTPNLMKNMNLHIQAQQNPSRVTLKRSTAKHLIIKLMKDRDKKGILKAAREKQIIQYKGSSIRVTASFSSETVLSFFSLIMSIGAKKFLCLMKSNLSVFMFLFFGVKFKKPVLNPLWKKMCANYISDKGLVS